MQLSNHDPPSALGNLYASSDGLVTESLFTIKWKEGSGKEHAGYILVHGVDADYDEFWFDAKDYYGAGWTWENPMPVWYEYRSFRCE